MIDRGGYYGIDIGALPVDQYEYELTYQLPGEATPYYTGTGRFSVTGATTAGSVNVVGTVNASNQLILKGNVTALTGIEIIGGATLSATAQPNATYAVDLSSLPRGHYQYRIVRSTGTDSLVSEFDVTASTVAGPAVVQEIFGLTDPNNGFARRIEVANLPAGTASVILAYRRLGDTGPFISKTSTTIVGGNFAFNYDDVVNGIYEYQLTAKGVDGATLAISAGSSGNFTVKRGAQAIATQTGGTQSTLIPLTRLDHDIFGNVVQQTRYANGEATTDAFGNPVAVASAQDQHAYTYYDGFGHALQIVDGERNRSFYSYDAAGRVAKSWQLQTNADGVGRFVVKAFGYDGNGNQTSTTEVLSDGAVVQSRVVYDAFGNIVRKGTDDDWQEYYQYDNAGRLWRTNQGDGVDKVYLHNLQGRATAEIRSQGRDLSSNQDYPDAEAVAALTSDVVRTNTLYDALGRTVGQVQPSFVSGTTPGSDAATLTVENRLVTSHSTLSRWTYRAGEKWHLVQDEAIYVNLPSTMAWGNGQVTVTVDYTLSDGTKRSSTFSPATFDALTASTSWRIDVFEWFGWQPYVATLDWVRVTKVVDGKTVLLFDQAANATSTPNVVLVEKPANPNVQIGFRYRDAGSSSSPGPTYRPAPGLIADAYYGFNIGSLPVGAVRGRADLRP
ncbi:MAG: hypothetical protein M0C28_17625 [Candidatus Moduliflexus flocculans]|nr:hypothetical protein [Candidatus Moduliflexus flocculans]